MKKTAVVLTVMLALSPMALVFAQTNPQGFAPAVALSSASAPAVCDQYEVTSPGCEAALPSETVDDGNQMNHAAQDAAQDSQFAADILNGGAGRREGETGGVAFAAEPRDGETLDERAGSGGSQRGSTSNEVTDVAGSVESSAATRIGDESPSQNAAPVKITSLPESGGLPIVLLLTLVVGGSSIAIWALIK